jgi:hypothetical protein
MSSLVVSSRGVSALVGRLHIYRIY